MVQRTARTARRKAPTKASGTVEVPEAAPRAALPDFIPPELATLVDKAPDGDRSLHEIKFDGYRTAGHVRSGRVRMLTRKGLEWTVRFHPIADALGGLKALNAYLDGEIAVVGEDGVTSFAELQAVLSDGPASRLVYYAFDLLHLDRRDLMPLPLMQRKEALQTLLAGLQEIGRIVDQAVGQPVGEHVPSQSSPIVGTGRRAANAHCVAWR